MIVGNNNEFIREATPKELIKALDEIHKARSRLICNEPFFGVLALNLEPVPDSTQPTFYTDGTVMGYNPAFTLSITNEQVQFEVCHEVCHCALGHPWRRNGRDHERWNRACDYVINLELLLARFSVPKDALLDHQYAGLSSEQVYAMLEAGEEEEGNKKKKCTCKLGDGPTAKSSSKDPDPNSPKSPKPPETNTEEEWKVKVIQAATAAGKLTGNLAKLVETAKKANVDWKSVTRRFIEETAKNDYSWKTPNPRYIPLGFYLPSLISDKLKSLVISVDCSGSVWAVQDQFFSEIKAIVNEALPEKVYVIYWDYNVTGFDTFEKGDPIEFRPRGGGGTDFKPSFKHIDDLQLNPSCMIVLTDLEGDFPTKVPDYPVLWATTVDHNVPFGEKVSIAPDGRRY